MTTDKLTTDKPTTQRADGGSEYNPFIPPQLDNPYPFYARARKEMPVFYSPMVDRWIVTRYDDISQILKDPIRFSSVDIMRSYSSPLPPAVIEVLKEGYPDMGGIMINEDPPRHSRLRGLLNKAFSTEHQLAMEPRIRANANALVDTFVHDGRADIITQYAMHLPIMVICSIIGLPTADSETIKRRCDSMNMLQLGGAISLEQQVALARDVVDFQRYLAALIEERRAVPQNDLVTELVNAHLEGENPLSTAEIVNLLTLLCLAGNETTTKLIGNALLLLLSHPAQLQALREDLSLAANVVEETLRIDSPVQAQVRTTTQAVEIGGVAVPAGAHIQLMLASANHDELYFPDGNRFDIHREQLKHKHLSFGQGIHYCLGAPLGRLEAKITIEVLLQWLPNLRLQPDQVLDYEPNLHFRGLSHLFLEWDAAVAVGS